MIPAERLLMLDRAALIEQARQLSSSEVDLLEEAVTAICAERQSVVAAPLDLALVTSQQHEAQMQAKVSNLRSQETGLQNDLQHADTLAGDLTVSMAVLPTVSVTSLVGLTLSTLGEESSPAVIAAAVLIVVMAFLASAAASRMLASPQRRFKLAAALVLGGLALLAGSFAGVALDQWIARVAIGSVLLVVSGAGIAVESLPVGPVTAWRKWWEIRSKRKRLTAVREEASEAEDQLQDATGSVARADNEARSARAYFDEQAQSIVAGVRLAAAAE